MALDWDSYIEQESEYVVLPEGDYDFTVTKFERGQFDGSEKVEPCPKAILELTISVPGMGKSTMKENLLLSEKVEWKLCAFFRSIGQKTHGQGCKMNWNAVLGAKGRAHVIVNEYQGNDGTTKRNNKVDMYLDPETELGGGEDW